MIPEFKGYSDYLDIKLDIQDTIGQLQIDGINSKRIAEKKLREVLIKLENFMNHLLDEV